MSALWHSSLLSCYFDKWICYQSHRMPSHEAQVGLVHHFRMHRQSYELNLPCLQRQLSLHWVPTPLGTFINVSSTASVNTVVLGSGMLLHPAQGFCSSCCANIYQLPVLGASWAFLLSESPMWGVGPPTSNTVKVNLLNRRGCLKVGISCCFHVPGTIC